MAIRSGSSGPLIAVVVFVILTVLSIATAIYFFTERNKSDAIAMESKRALAAVVSAGYLDQDPGAKVRQAAEGENKSVVEYLVSKNTEVAVVVTGETSADSASVRSALGLKPEQTAKQSLESSRRSVLEAEAKTVEQQKIVEQLTVQMATVQAQADEKSKSADEKVLQLTATIEPYRASTEAALASIQELKDQLTKARDEAKSEYANQIAEEKNKQASLVSANQGLSGRVTELQKQLDAFRITPKDPSLLVDGTIIDLAATKDQLFISLGTKDRVRPGMTFEVYSDATAIMYDPKTDRQTPGYASIEIIKVGDTTSTARVTRKAPRKSILKGDVIANAVYSPTYQYKFLVHGKFDVDNDGKVTDGETDYIRAKIRDWGGIVVEGEEITPDIDFVVIGSIPLKPQMRSMGESDAAYAASLSASRAYDSYQELLTSASAAQIPILNWNRFQILTGAAER